MRRIISLLFAVFMLVAASAGAQSAAVNYGSTIATGHPDIFGMSGWPCNGTCQYDQTNFNYPGSPAMQQTMMSIGGSFVRSYLHVNQLLANTTTSQYRTDMAAGCPANSTCDPNGNKWTWNGPTDTDGQVTEQIKSAGAKLMLILGDAPAWDTTDGVAGDVPSDLVVYQDIQKKIFKHFNPDIVEVWPEPNTPGWSPAQYASVYQNVVAAVRSVNGSVPIGGPGVTTSCGGSDGSACWQSYVDAMYASGAEIDYLSAHNYSGTNFSMTMANLAKQHGVPVYETEWNQDGTTDAPVNGDTVDSISFVGYTLATMMNAGYMGSNYYSGHYYYDNSSLFSVGTPTGGNLLPKSATWLLMANKLGLGAGNFSVKSSSQNGLSAVVGAINSAGQPVVVLINDSASPVAGSLTLNGLGQTGGTSFQAYLADHVSNNAVSPVSSGNVNVSSGAASLSFSMTSYSVEGIVLGASVGSTPTPTSGPSATPTPSGSPAKTCAVTESSPAANAVMSGSAYPIVLTITCDGKYDHARWSIGPKGASGETGHVNLPYGVNRGAFDTTTQLNGPTQSAVAIFLDAAETQRVQASVAPGYGWFAGQIESINNVATPTPAPTPALGCTNIGLISPAVGSIVASPVTFASNFTGCSGWPGASGFMRVEQTAPYPIHYDGAAGSPITVATLAPGTYTVYPTFWSNSVTPVRGSGASITFTVGVPPTPRPIPTPPPTPVPTPTLVPPTPTPVPTPTSCKPSLISPAQLSTVGSSVTFMVSALGCNNWPGASGFLRIEQTSPYPIHYDGNPGSGTTIAPLAAGAYRVYATLWLNSVTQIGVATPPVNFTVGVATITPSPTPTRTSSPTPTPTPGPTPTPDGIAPIRANDFLNSLGVDTHIIQGVDSTGQVIASLQYTGIRNIRDDATHDPTMFANLCNVHKATGAMVDELPIVDSDPYDIQDSLTEYESLAACGAMLAAEGPNEANNFNFNYNGNRCSTSSSFAPCAQYQTALYKAVKNDPKLAAKPVWSLTEPGSEPDNQGLQFLTIPGGAGTLQPSGTVYADAANLHNYVRGNGQNAIQDNQAWFAESDGASQGSWDGLDGEFLNQTWNMRFSASPYSTGSELPKVTTETGWPTDGSITSDQQGKLLVNLYLSAAKRKWSYTFIYKMFDDTYDLHGLFAYNPMILSPKSSATYIHNMTSILSDSSSGFTPAALNYSIPGEPATVHDLLLQKSDGTYELAVWGDQIAGESATLTVNLGRTLPTVNIYDVTSGTSPIQALRNVSSVSLTLTDHAFFIEFGGTPGAFQSGTYVIGAPYVIDGGFYQAYWGYPPAAEAYPNNQPNPWQQFKFAVSGGAFTICNVETGACLTDGSSVVDIGQGTDSWMVTSSGSGWTLQNTRTGKYMGAVPSVSRGNIPMSITPVSINLRPG